MGSLSCEPCGVEAITSLYGLRVIETDLGDLAGVFIRWKGGGVIIFNTASPSPYEFLRTVFSVHA